MSNITLNAASGRHFCPALRLNVLPLTGDCLCLAETGGIFFVCGGVFRYKNGGQKMCRLGKTRLLGALKKKSVPLKKIFLKRITHCLFSGHQAYE